MCRLVFVCGAWEKSSSGPLDLALNREIVFEGLRRDGGGGRLSTAASKPSASGGSLYASAGNRSYVSQTRLNSTYRPV